ncbi:hypothetical protein DFJ77DRAFT_531363 [Powellomyces hirtus]|nr:hypothetical protein DFJ77DRAFT_531363 [Powellomyces hirtus]
MMQLLTASPDCLDLVLCYPKVGEGTNVSETVRICVARVTETCRVQHWWTRYARAQWGGHHADALSTARKQENQISDSTIIADMMAFALDNPAPSVLVLVSGDGDVSNVGLAVDKATVHSPGCGQWIQGLGGSSDGRDDNAGLEIGCAVHRV